MVEHYDAPDGGVRRMTPKEWLSQAITIDRHIEALQEQIDRTNAMLTRCTQQGGGRVSGGKSDWTETVMRLQQLEAELRQEIERMVDVKRQIREAIDLLPDVNMRLIMERRYINGWGWQKIIRSVNYSEDGVWSAHRRALRLIVVPDTAKVYSAVQ